jgi:ABC-type cobalamin/Fe3+-siderophores transport system ATPase subunit
MKISHIKISNILGIEALEFSPEGFTAITGPNGAGKTSILEAIKAATGQGHDATLLRKGAEKGEVVLVLDDGTEIQQRVTATRTTRDVVKDGKKLTQPGNAIKALTDALSVNPVEFLTARKQDRVKVLLESMPITLDLQKLSEISRVQVQASVAHPLQIIDAVRQQVYDDRTGTNRAVKEKDATINQLRMAMPSAPGGVDGSEDELREQITQAGNIRQAEHERIDTKLMSMRKESAAKVQALKDEAQATIDSIKNAVAAAVEAEREVLADIEAKASRVRQKATDTCVATTQPLQAALQVIVANRDAAAKRKATQETIDKMQADLLELQADAAAQTKSLEDIDAYKSELLASLPIPGLEVIDGEVLRDGIPFDRLNTAQRVSIAFEIAKLRAGDLRLICLDGMELLDDGSLDEMRKQAAASDVQVFVTRVQSNEFSVETK